MKPCPFCQQKQREIDDLKLEIQRLRSKYPIVPTKVILSFDPTLWDEANFLETNLSENTLVKKKTTF